MTRWLRAGLIHLARYGSSKKSLLGPGLMLVAPLAQAGLVQEFYLPMPEQQIYQANSAIASGTPSTMASTFSIVVTGNGTVIYYDQWEDGYETDLGNPAQPTTRIWGDGNDAHGIPPGFTHNPAGLPAGTVITLTNNVTLPRNPATILWDARDRVAANKALIISRAGWPVPTGPVFAGAVSVLSTMDYGTNYISPVGQNLPNNLFKYVGLFIMAAQPNTAVTIDPNGNGVGKTNIVLNQGESYLVNGGIMTGGRVTATKPIQADLIIGHVGAAYASDWFTLYPVSAWSSAYYTPVGTAAKVSQPAYVYLYNPGTNAITINYQTQVGTGSFSVPGTNGVYQFQMPVGSGASFLSAGGQAFYALCTVAANNASDTAYNWGFTLVPQGALTTEAAAGWAPGSADGTVNGSPVWVTALAGTKLYVDYKGDHLGPLTDPNGNQYDTNFTVTALQSQKIFDPGKNQTGLRVYTVDGILITAAWGEDPDTAQPGNPYLDAGTTVLPFPVPLVKKTVLVVTDAPPTGLSIGDVIQYTVTLDNKGLLPLGNTVVIDAPSGNLTYVPHSTTLNSNTVPDNASGAAFPLAAPAGYNIPVILSQNTSTFQYRAQVNAGGVVSNNVNIGGTAISASAFLAPPPSGPAPTLNFTDTNGVITSAYAVGTNVFVTMTNAAANTVPSLAQTIAITVANQTNGDLQTITLTETGNNTGVFRNLGGLPTSATSGLAQQDGILNVAPGDRLSVSYTDPNSGISTNATATVMFPTPSQQLYLSVNGSTNGTQALNRIDPVAYGHGPTRTSMDIGAGGTGAVTVDATSTRGTNGASALTISHSTGSGQNRLMLVAIGIGNSSANKFDIASVTYAGRALTNVGRVTAAAGSGGTTARPQAEIWALVNPPSGTTNVIITAGGTRALSAGVTTFAGVSQTAPLADFVSNSGTTGTAATVPDAGTAPGQVEFDVAVVGAYYSGTGAAAPAGTPGAGQIRRWSLTNDYATAGELYIASSGSTSNSTGSSVAMSRSWSGNFPWAIGAVSILPAAGGGGPATNATTFAQTPAFGLPFTLPAGGAVAITNFITITNGSLSAGPAITATLRFNGTNIITLSNPTYSSVNSSLVWSGQVATNVTIPAGQTISYVISNGVPGVAFHVNYDSTNAPSVIVLSASTAIQVNTFGIYDAPYPGGNLVTAPIAGATLYIRAMVSDPFGSYDITSLGLAVTGPNASVSFTNLLTAANVVASNSTSKTYEYPWTTGPTTGDYTIAVTAHQGTEGVTATAVASITTTFLDLGTPSTTGFTSGNNGPATNSYPAGSPICIQVSDLNRNTNAATTETIMATVTSSAGDSEIITLFETGTNTGVFANCINVSTNAAGTINDGTLSAPVGAILTASYSDPTDVSDNTSATATVQPAPGVPGIVMSKVILSPTSNQVGLGQSVTFNLLAVNVGSTTLANVSIADMFPTGGLSYAAASLAPSTVATGRLTWNNLGGLTPGQSTNITVTFNTLATGTVTNFATANGGTATNTSSVTLQINQAALKVTKILLSPTNTPVAVGSDVVFRITVQNIGNTAVNYLPLEDTFSGTYYQFVSSTITNDGAGAGSLIWTNLAYPVALATNASITNDVTMKVVGQGNPANNTATVDFAIDVFGNLVPPAASTIGVNTASASISGHVYNDLNQSGVYTNGDIGLSGITLQLFTDPNGDGDPSDGTLGQITATDASGSYELLNLNPGQYVVVAGTRPGYVSSAPVNNRLAINLVTLTASTNHNFFQYLPSPSLYSTISGTVWNDANGNGTNDVGETGSTAAAIDLVQDVNTNGAANSGEPLVASVTTDASGNYSFAGIPPGQYVIRATTAYGYYSTGNSQGRTDRQISFVSTNGIIVTNNDFLIRTAPVAVADSGAAFYFVPTTLYPLTNDLSPNGDALSITNLASPDGTVAINAGGTSLNFTPTNLGPTTVTYTIADAHGGTASAVMMVTVTEPMHFSSIRYTNGGFLLSWFGPTTNLYRVRYSDTLTPVNWQSFTNLIAYAGPPTPTDGLFTFFDDGSQTPPGLPPIRFYQLILLGSASGLTSGLPATNTVASGSTAYYSINVPPNADWATNTLLFAGSPVNLLFNPNALPTGANAGDYTLLMNSSGGVSILGGSSTPPLLSGATYCLGVQNTNDFPVNFGLQVNFHLVTPPNRYPISSMRFTNGGFLLTWFASSNDLFQAQWTTNLVSPVNWMPFPGIITSTNGNFFFADTNAPVRMKFYELLLLP